ncbi:MAG: AFG1 family ATPase [Thiogranum sp.]|nr:AFG1 family ATPase [Thiogranum sp.]
MTPRERYQADLARQALQADAAQQAAVDQFQMLYERVLRTPPCVPLWKYWLGRRPAAPTGLYLWGGPGRGKTYLMDCFFESLPFVEKRRVHFHRFMLEIHSALDALPKTPDPLRIVADSLAARCRVLCLDEFHVSDIADAMLLSGLLEALLARGLVLVATSNTSPEGLYENGLQRKHFEPAIALLQSHTRVVHLDTGQDFRLALLQHGGTYKVADSDDARKWLRDYLGELSPVDFQTDATVRLFGRDIRAIALADDVAWFDFQELCMQPRSARDYLELAREFHTLLLEGVPCMGEGMDEAARRFIHLIDALYDHGVKLVVTAATSPEQLYKGCRLENLFRRTASRLTEMSSSFYLAKPHRPD